MRTVRFFIGCVLITLSISSLGRAEEQSRVVDFQVYLWRMPTQQIVDQAASQRTNTRLEMDAYIPPDIGYLNGDSEEVELMDIAEGRLSERYRYRGSGLLRFVLPSDDSAQMPHRLLAEVALPDGVDEALVLLFPTSQGGYQSVVVDSSAIGFSNGQARVMNMTPGEVALEVETQQFSLRRGEAVTFDLDQFENRALSTRLAIRDEEGGWHRRPLQSIVLSQQSRSLLLLYRLRINQYRLLVLEL